MSSHIPPLLTMIGQRCADVNVYYCLLLFVSRRRPLLKPPLRDRPHTAGTARDAGHFPAAVLHRPRSDRGSFRLCARQGFELADPLAEASDFGAHFRDLAREPGEPVLGPARRRRRSRGSVITGRNGRGDAARASSPQIGELALI